MSSRASSSIVDFPAIDLDNLPKKLSLVFFKLASSFSVLDLNSGYIQRVAHQLPKQGSRDPWVNTQNYLKDLFQVRFKSLEDSDLKFKKAG